ncbi:MAG: hypothetical protein M1457_00170 [bacterium]|nr:hypothetical protein [bacterium]
MGLGVVGAWAYALVLHGQVNRSLALAEEPTPTPTPTPTRTPARSTAADAPASAGAHLHSGGQGPAGDHGRPPDRPPMDGFGRPGASGPAGTPGRAGEMPASLKDLLKSKAIFGRPPTPNVAIQGILNDMILVNNEWIAIGEEKNGIKVIAIDGSKATIEMAGQRRDIDIWQQAPMNQPGQGGRPGSPGPPPGMMPPPGEPQPAAPPAASPASAPSGSLPSWFDPSVLEKLPPQMRDKILQAVREGKVTREMYEQGIKRMGENQASGMLPGAGQ